jgi:hypothetical protein
LIQPLGEVIILEIPEQQLARGRVIRHLRKRLSTAKRGVSLSRGLLTITGSVSNDLVKGQP